VKIKPYMTHEQRSTTSDELRALSKVMRGLEKRRLKLKVGSSAISNGIEDLPTPDVFIEPEIVPNPETISRPEVISEPEVDSIVSDLDDLGGFDDVSKPEDSEPVSPPVPTTVVEEEDEDEEETEETPGPPTPPTSVRRN